MLLRIFFFFRESGVLDLVGVSFGLRDIFIEIQVWGVAAVPIKLHPIINLRELIFHNKETMILCESFNSKQLFENLFQIPLSSDFHIDSKLHSKNLCLYRSLCDLGFYTRKKP